MIDVSFDVYSDTPKGRDPDSYSPTLRNYHKILWSKELPSGNIFNLSDEIPRKLKHSSRVGEFIISSDSIGHTYKYTKALGEIVRELPSHEMDAFFLKCSTIGAYMVFPANKVGNKMTINGSRGLNRNIKDRFDLTLECIRLYYLDTPNPLSETFERYSSFFNLFENFQGYVDFFLLQDLVSREYDSVNFWLPFFSFKEKPLPGNIGEYRLYKNNLIRFISNRNKRIASQ
jgi:hypothetical protein